MRIQQIEQHVCAVMTQIQHPELRLAHDFAHVDRVRRWAYIIAQNEDFADLDQIEAAALLHDIGLAYVDQRRDHAQVGAQRAAQFLADHQIFSAVEINSIAEAIRWHSSLSGGGWLGIILRDADMLDLFGAIGIMRACTSKYDLPEYDPHNLKGDTWGMRATHFTERFAAGTGIGPHIVDQINFQISCYDNLHTATAKRFAQPLLAFMRTYIHQLEAQVSATTTHRAR